MRHPLALTPVLYALSVPVVFVASVAGVACVERTTGLHAVWRQGDVDFALACGSLGAVVFGLATLGLVRLELLDRPRLRDHLRHCAVVYLVVAAGVLALVLNYRHMFGGLFYGLLAGATLATAYAAVVNGVVLTLVARRFSSGRRRTANTAGGEVGR